MTFYRTILDLTRPCSAVSGVGFVPCSLVMRKVEYTNGVVQPKPRSGVTEHDDRAMCYFDCVTA